jgi:hypothetical protein
MSLLARQEARLQLGEMLLRGHPAGSGAARGTTMPGVSEETLRQAREVDLLTYLQEKEPWELKRSAPGEYRTASHGSLVISHGMWFWHRGQVGGASALDYLIKIRGMGFVEAVETVSGIRASPSYSPLQAKSPEPRRTDKTLSLPPSARFPKEMLSYLQNRGISPNVIKRCMDAGILYEGRCSGEAVCVFVGRDETGKARFGCMRSVHSGLKRDCLGSDKRFGFRLAQQSSASGALAVFESPIDSISHLCLFPSQDCHRLSLGGTSDAALLSFLERHPLITNISLCLDADEAGQTAARKIKATLAADDRFSHLSVTIDPPEQGKDYNEMLLSVKAAEREQSRAGRRKEAGLSL